MKKEIVASDAQSAKGLLSQALISNGMIYTSGFIHLTPDGKLVQGTVGEKLAQVMLNTENTLKVAGATLDDVVKVTIYVTDIEIVPELNKHYVKYFKDPMPVREAIQVVALPLGAEIEISVVAEAS
jgi:2-iminobutanoate/2-iminopropanoate deaminase